MGPFRDELDSANATIARLQAKIAEIRSRAPWPVRVEWWLRKRPRRYAVALVVTFIVGAVLMVNIFRVNDMFRHAMFNALQR